MKTKFIILGIFLLLAGAITLLGRTPVSTFVTDMFNQISIKPQEEGSISTFPIGAVSIDGHEIMDPTDRFNWLEKEYSRKDFTNNPIPPVAASIANGKLKFNTYCFVCHGDTKEVNAEGFAQTKNNALGMIAPAVIALTPQFTDGYIFQKATKGGAVMPPLGYALTTRDRWDIINYIRELEKQQ